MEQLIVDNIYFEITNACNLRCKHCYNDSGNGNLYLSPESIVQFVLKNISLGTRRVTLSGGEALLHPQLITILEKLINLGLFIEIITNGTLLCKETLCHLQKFRSNISFQISLEGADPQTNDLVQGTGSFTKCMDNVSLLIKEGFNYRFRFSITNYNYKYLRDMIELCLRYNRKTVAFSQLTPYGRTQKNKDLLLTNDAKKIVVKSLLDLKMQYLGKINFEVPEVFESTGCPIFSKKDKILVRPRIDAQGYVYLCQLFQGEDLSVGTIDAFSFKNLFNSEEYLKLAEKIEKRAQNEHCKNCQIWFVCHGGCPAVSLSIGQPLDGFCVARQHRFNLFLKKMIGETTIKHN